MAISRAELRFEARAGRRAARALAHERVASALAPALLAPPPPDLPRELVTVFRAEVERLVSRAAPKLIEPAPKFIKATPILIEATADRENTPAAPSGAAEPSMPE
jgi:hypothetical protein